MRYRPLFVTTSRNSSKIMSEISEQIEKMRAFHALLKKNYKMLSEILAIDFIESKKSQVMPRVLFEFEEFEKLQFEQFEFEFEKGREPKASDLVPVRTGEVFFLPIMFNRWTQTYLITVSKSMLIQVYKKIPTSLLLFSNFEILGIIFHSIVDLSFKKRYRSKRWSYARMSKEKRDLMRDLAGHVLISKESWGFIKDWKDQNLIDLKGLSRCAANKIRKKRNVAFKECLEMAISHYELHK